MADELFGDGSTISIGSAVGNTYGLTFSSTASAEEITNCADTSRRYMGAMPEITVSGDAYLEDDDGNNLYAQVGDTVSCTLTAPSGFDVDFSAVLTKWDISGMAPNEKLAASFELKVSGALTPGS